MTHSEEKINTPLRPWQHLVPLIFIGTSLIAIVAAFALANSDYEFEKKTQGFSAIIIGYLIFSGIAYWTGDGYLPFFEGRRGFSDEEIESRLFSIEEASNYFGGALKPSDMFRLMSSRVNDLVPYDCCILLLVERASLRMKVVQADGENAERLNGIHTPLENGLAGRALSSRMVQIDRGLTLSDVAFADEAVVDFRSSAALPLTKNGDVFAVLQLFSRSKTAFDGGSIELLEAIGERVTPMVLSSISFERNLSTSLIDPLTELPNERAFFMIVENQIAESQRNRDVRPVSILSIDIKYFGEVNETYGHAAGDRLLSFVAQKIKGQLRQMDFFSRAVDDEFLVIMPTASAKVAAEIVSRIDSDFLDCFFSVNETQSVEVELSFGAATFWHDGETAQSLLAVARERKAQTKSKLPAKVVWFPKEYVN